MVPKPGLCVYRARLTTDLHSYLCAPGAGPREESSTTAADAISPLPLWSPRLPAPATSLSGSPGLTRAASMALLHAAAENAATGRVSARSRAPLSPIARSMSVGSPRAAELYDLIRGRISAREHFGYNTWTTLHTAASAVPEAPPSTVPPLRRAGSSRINGGPSAGPRRGTNSSFCSGASVNLGTPSMVGPWHRMLLARRPRI